MKFVLLIELTSGMKLTLRVMLEKFNDLQGISGQENDLQCVDTLAELHHSWQMAVEIIKHSTFTVCHTPADCRGRRKRNAALWNLSNKPSAQTIMEGIKQTFGPISLITTEVTSQLVRCLHEMKKI